MTGYAEDAMKQLHGQSDVRQWEVLPPVYAEVFEELKKARATHAPMNGHHEGYAVILEELDELWEVCKSNTHKIVAEYPGVVRRATEKEQAAMSASKRAAMRKEAIQVAAMAIRFIEDVCDKT